MKEKYLINARIIDPKNQIDENGGIVIDENGKIKGVGKSVSSLNIPNDAEKMDLRNKILIPSVKAIIPFLLRSPNSVICFPSVFFVKLAAG